MDDPHYIVEAKSISLHIDKVYKQMHCFGPWQLSITLVLVLHVHFVMYLMLNQIMKWIISAYWNIPQWGDFNIVLLDKYRYEMFKCTVCMEIPVPHDALAFFSWSYHHIHAYKLSLILPERRQVYFMTVRDIWLGDWDRKILVNDTKWSLTTVDRDSINVWISLIPWWNVLL